MATSSINEWMFNKLRRTFVLFLHAEGCPLDGGFNVMINCCRRQNNYQKLISHAGFTPRERKQTKLSFPSSYLRGFQVCFSLCSSSPALPQVLCFSTCTPHVLCSSWGSWVIQTQSLSGRCWTVPQKTPQLEAKKCSCRTSGCLHYILNTSGWNLMNERLHLQTCTYRTLDRVGILLHTEAAEAQVHLWGKERHTWVPVIPVTFILFQSPTQEWSKS